MKRLGLYCATAALCAMMYAQRVSASDWYIKEGACSEWEGVWTMTDQGNGTWIGEVSQEQVGGNCVGATHQRLTGRVNVSIKGPNTFVAKKSRMSDGNNCTYTATLSVGKNPTVSGFYYCPQAPGKQYNFRLTDT